MVETRLLSFLIDKIKKNFGAATPIQLVLYGSRARGDHQDRSDYDLALKFPTQLHSAWVHFASDVSEDAPSLKKIDLVNFAECDEPMKTRIQQEGQTVYEQ